MFLIRKRRSADAQYFKQRLHHSHKKRIVWKHEPNWPFYAFMLRTKLYQNPFFFNGDRNVNKPRSRAARIVYRPIYLPFYKNIVCFFSFFCQDTNKTRSNRAIIDCNSSKKHKLILYKTQNGDVDYKFFFDFCQELPVQKFGDRHPNTTELTSQLVHVLCNAKVA